MLTEQELELFNSDGKYRSYTNGIDKALKNFEYSSEWPDLISALGKLSKVISTNSTKYRSIPKTLIISKRLAQCLHPSLPSGVHIKTLEVYDLIFKCLCGNTNNIFIYSTGLFPLLQYAGISVRPMILKIYEDHFLQLGENLESILDGLLIGLLNGMEDGSDVYERSTTLLTSIKTAVTPNKFYPKLWSSMIVNTTRLPAINYMITDGYVPTNPKEILPELLNCLNDTNILVQRSTLELLNTWNMKDWPLDARIEVLAGSMGTLLRRDVSLNRRFFSMIKDEDWIVVDAAKTILSYHPDKFRIIMMLFDKPEVSCKIMDAILIDVIRALHLHQENDVMQMFITNLEPDYIIGYLSKQEITEELCQLMFYIYKHINNGDFSPLVLKLIEPTEYKLKLGIALLAHCQNQSQSHLKEEKVIRDKLFAMYSSIIEYDHIEFRETAEYEYKFVMDPDQDLDHSNEIPPTMPSTITICVQDADDDEVCQEKTDSDREKEEGMKMQNKNKSAESTAVDTDATLIANDTTDGNNKHGDNTYKPVTISTPELTLDKRETEDKVDKFTSESSSPNKKCSDVDGNGDKDTNLGFRVSCSDTDEPLTNYYSLNESLACDSVLSCNHHFGLNPSQSSTFCERERDPIVSDYAKDFQASAYYDFYKTNLIQDLNESENRKNEKDSSLNSICNGKINSSEDINLHVNTATDEAESIGNRSPVTKSKTKGKTKVKRKAEASPNSSPTTPTTPTPTVINGQNVDMLSKLPSVPCIPNGYDNTESSKIFSCYSSGSSDSTDDSTDEDEDENEDDDTEESESKNESESSDDLSGKVADILDDLNEHLDKITSLDEGNYNYMVNDDNANQELMDELERLRGESHDFLSWSTSNLNGEAQEDVDDSERPGSASTLLYESFNHAISDSPQQGQGSSQGKELENRRSPKNKSILKAGDKGKGKGVVSGSSSPSAAKMSYDTSESDDTWNSEDKLKSILHKLIPNIVTAPVDTIDPWLSSLLTSCYAPTITDSKQQALNAFLSIILYIPMKKLRKHPVVTRIIESLWKDKNYDTLAKFLFHFPEMESLIVIKLNQYEEICNFQEFILSNTNNSMDNCILKLIDNLDCDNNLIIHASHNCLNEVVNKFSYIIVDPLIINLLDKSTRRHYTEYKSNSTPDLRGSELMHLSTSSMPNASKFIHRSTGNLSHCDSQLNILIYNGVYDNRRIKFILDKLSKMFKFPEFIMKLCIVNLSESPRFRLICKLIGQLYYFNNYNCNYIHIIICCLINYITSFYHEEVGVEDVHGNLEIQVTACSILNELGSNLISLTNSNLNHQSNSFSCYIDSVMKDTKLVKKILGGLLSILNLDDGMELSNNYRLLQFNYSHPYYSEIILVEYIKLLTTLIQLESRVLTKDPITVNEGKKYVPNVPIMDQLIFKTILMKGLLNCSVHWESLLRKSIAYCNNMRIVQQTIHILCENLTSKSQTHESSSINLSTLTTILHYIILDTNHHDNTEIKSSTSESSWYNPLTWLPTLNNNNNNNNNNVNTKDLGIKYQTKLNLLGEFGSILKTVVHVWIHFPSLKPKIINLLNPIALNHMEEFISSTSDISTTDDLVDIVFQLNVIRLTNLTNSTIHVIQHGKSATNIINMLTLYSKYIEKLSTINYDLPNSLLISLIREGSVLNLPLGQNLVLMILNRIMCTIGLQSNWSKNEIKELQEVTQKLLESISTNTSSSDNKKKGGVIHQQDVIISSLNCLSDNLHGLLDIVWGSDDKDKLLPILSHMIYLLMGHLKGKQSPTFSPTTILLTNLTKYTHLRKAWKKEIFEYLIEASFFRMNMEDFQSWMIILDNIFSQDKNSFTELIARATVPTSNSLNIFTSKETEYENRASLLKRLAIVIHSSDTDEYIKFITSIQERISESLKASPIVIPSIQLNVFLLFRVLLKKLSHGHLTSLWPIIIHEIGIVFSILEQYLINPHSLSQYSIQKEGGTLDRLWTQLFCSVFKILREASFLPIFRMYSWNFTNNIIPHLKQLNKDLITDFENNITSIDEDFIEL